MVTHDRFAADYAHRSLRPVNGVIEDKPVFAQLSCCMSPGLQLTYSRSNVCSRSSVSHFRDVCEVMKRSVSTILIPLLLVSQSLFSVPHSHAGSSIAEPDGHAARSHVHLHGAHHHHGHYDDETPSSTGEQVPDHDSDVVYDGDDQLLYEGKVANTARAELAALYFIGDDSSAIAALCRICGRLTSPAVLRSKCALYSQLLSIRC